jgi:hypothetical protein
MASSTFKNNNINNTPATLQQVLSSSPSNLRNVKIQQSTIISSVPGTTATTPVKYAGTKFYTTSPSPKALPIPVFKLNDVNNLHSSQFNSSPSLYSCSLPSFHTKLEQQNTNPADLSLGLETPTAPSVSALNEQSSFNYNFDNEKNVDKKSNSAPSSPPKITSQTNAALPVRRPSAPPKPIFEKSQVTTRKPRNEKSLNLNASFISENIGNLPNQSRKHHNNSLKSTHSTREPDNIPPPLVQKESNMLEGKVLAPVDPKKVTILKRPKSSSLNTNPHSSLNLGSSTATTPSSLETISSTLQQMLKLKV